MSEGWLACLDEARRKASEVWCERGDSNPHGIATASPSSWCVCQFRHFREAGKYSPSARAEAVIVTAVGLSRNQLSRAETGRRGGRRRSAPQGRLLLRRRRIQPSGNLLGQ